MRSTFALLALAGAGCTPVLHSPGDDTGGSWVAPENTWPRGDTPPADLSAEGFSSGQVIPDIRLMDQFGDEVSAWQWYGMVLAIDVSTIWCGPCARLADEVDATWNAYSDQGFMYITLLPENNVGQVPDQGDLEFWAEEHDISAPILSDGGGYSAQIVPDASYPKILIVGRNMKVAVPAFLPASDDSVRDAIEGAL